MLKRLILSVLLITLLVMVGACAPNEEESEKVDPKEGYTIDIYTYQAGTSTYVFGLALADLINENSTWLKAEAVESPGPMANVLAMAQDPSKRTKMIAYCTPYDAYKGNEPFNEVYDGLKQIFCTGIVMDGLVTNNPNIKKTEDLSGKVICLRGPRSAEIDFYTEVLNESGLKNVRYEYPEFSAGVDALIEKRVDAFCVSAFVETPEGNKWVPNPATEELLAREKNLYYLNFDAATDKRLRTEKGGRFEDFHASVITIPAYAFAESQSEPWDVIVQLTSFMADESMPDEVVYEITRIAVENSDKFVSYHPRFVFVTPETLATCSFPDEFHEGAAKYFNEQGIEMKDISKLWQ